MRRLNLGCGHDVRPGYVNLDVVEFPGVDVVHDLNVLPLPFDDSEFDEILCSNVLEHVDYVPLLGELHRILRPRGRIRIGVPHFTSRILWIDPTHRHGFSAQTFTFFVTGGVYYVTGYFSFAFSDMPRVKIAFDRRWRRWWNYGVEPLVNLSRGTQNLYEETGLSRLFPAVNVELDLVR